MIYSWDDNDPEVTVGDDGTETYTFQRHQDQGTTSINILGGLPDRPSIPDDAESFTIAVDGVSEIDYLLHTSMCVCVCVCV